MRGQEVSRRDDPSLVVDHDEGAAPAIGAPVEIPPGDHHRPGETVRPLAGVREHGTPPPAGTPSPLPALGRKGGGIPSAEGKTRPPGRLPRLVAAYAFSGMKRLRVVVALR